MPSLLEAITEKYGSSEDDTFDQMPIAIYVPRKNPRNVLPKLLVLNDCDIDSAGNETDLRDKCHGVEELDLAQNRLSEWNEIFKILNIMPKLKFANLSFNNLSADINNTLPRGIMRDTYPCLKSVVLNSTNITWSSFKHILKKLPMVEEIHLSMNNYDVIELDDDENCQPIQIPSVTKLHFTGNPVSTWVEVCKLGRAFPNLESLVLAECPLLSLMTPPPSPDTHHSLLSYPKQETDSYDNMMDLPHDAFIHLRFLNLNRTLIRTWDDVDILGRFPALKYLRIQGCPLFEENPERQEYTEHERRQLLIARLPCIQTLNGGAEITADEREDAERFLIRFYMDKSEEERPDRYNEVVQVHGKLDRLVNIDLTPESKVPVLLVCGDKCESHTLDVYQTVLEFKQKLEKFFNIPAHRMRVFYADQQICSIVGPEEMKFPNKRLYSYNIVSGDQIIVDSKK
ncbi:tubulin-specific chaperone cofactor E-like protein [Daktulosphaira vitifoliae]|uniref:tubulin-specific chaperone cofactor E-like protein n=1 Tax=Daktulosphaira vitifoliae TaxID=58002 RepID=UPI0021AA3F07|nr:tubulin-specific chaperone cofactor E-like protein [Daktulosphaira vitifoliae]